ncbi:MAG: UDP-N-acetylglucosamine--N-acetylmuramyl-(pentapeptide) pyrophosphoryl-undecaprenol N-acetylglucosamine transferase [Pseudomonadota bacterium]
MVEEAADAADAAGRAPLLVIGAGGTGGHMYPAQALAEEMLGRDWRVVLSTDARGMRYAGGFPEAVERVEMQSASPSRGGVMAKLAAPFAIYRGIRAARARFAADRPACVAGFGGYPALPALAAALSMRIPRIIHEQNGVLGRVNRLFARRVDRVCCGTWPLKKTVLGATLEHVGNPVRAAAAVLRETTYAAPGQGPVSLVAFGGSQGAAAFARVVPQAVAALPETLRARLRVTQQVREGEEAAVRAAYAGAGVAAELAAFFPDMPARLAGAQLVIARAGASTIAELSVIGRPAILVPYPHAMDDHQTANAAALEAAGGAIVEQEAGLTAERLQAHLLRLLMTDPEECRRMAAAARVLGRPNAARELGDIVQTLGTGAKP